MKHYKSSITFGVQNENFIPYPILSLVQQFLPNPRIQSVQFLFYWIVLFVGFVSLSISCGGQPVDEYREAADTRVYEEGNSSESTDQNQPLVFSPFQLTGLYLDYRYYQKLDTDGTSPLHETWLIQHQGETYPVFSYSITGLDTIFGAKTSSIFDDVLWFLPKNKIITDPDFSIAEEIQGSNRHITISYTMKDGRQAIREHYHPVNADYTEYSGHDRDLKEYYADFLMLQAHVYGATRSSKESFVHLGDQHYEIKSIMGIDYSLEMRGVIIGGIVAGTSTIQKTEQGLIQTFNDHKERLFTYSHPDPNTLVLTCENFGLTEKQTFIKRDKGWECAQVTTSLPSGKQIRMKFDPPLFDIRFAPEELERSSFTIHLDDSGAVISGSVEIKQDENRVRWASMFPDDPSWCKRRPVHTHISSDNQTLILSSQVEHRPEEKDDDFDF